LQLQARLDEHLVRRGGWFALPLTITDTPQNDTILGTEASEKIRGDLGDDLIFGLGGDDYLEGGMGIECPAW